MGARFGIVAVIAACYSPQPSPGAPCGPGGACPDGLKCSTSGLCLAGEETGDAPVTPDGTLTPDTADAPRKRWNVVATSGEAAPMTSIATTKLGNTIVVGVETGALDAATEVTDDAGNTYQVIPQSRATNSGGENAVEIWIAEASKAGAKQVVASGPVIKSVVVWEIENLAPDPVVVVDTRSAQASSDTPQGVNITTTEQGQFVLSILIVDNFINGLTPGSAFTNDHSTLGNGWAHLTDDDAPPGAYQAEWSQPGGGTSCASAVVFRVAN